MQQKIKVGTRLNAIQALNTLGIKDPDDDILHTIFSSLKSNGKGVQFYSSHHAEEMGKKFEEGNVLDLYHTYKNAKKEEDRNWTNILQAIKALVN